MVRDVVTSMKSSLQSQGAPAPSLLKEMHRLRVIGALRLMLTLLLCVVIAAAFNTTTGIVSLAAPLVMMIFMHDESLRGGLDLIFGSLLGSAFFLTSASLFFQAHVLFLAANLAAILVLSYWAAQGIRGRWPSPFAAVFAILNIAGAAFASISGVDLGINATINWFHEITIGVLCAWFVLIGLWPSPRARDLDRICDGIQAECARLLRDLALRVAEDRPMTYRPSPVSLIFIGNMLQQIDSLKWRLANVHPNHEALRRRLAGLGHLYVNTRFTARAMEKVPASSLRPETRKALIDLLSGIADQIADAPSGDIEGPRALIRARSRSLGSSPERPDSAGNRLSVKLAAISNSTDALIGDLERLATRGTHPMPIPSARAAKQSAARFQLDSGRAAIKMTLGILLGLSLHLLPMIPAGTYLVLGIIIVLAQPNLGRSHLRVRLWFPGVLGGTIYSLVGLALVSLVPHFGLLLAWLALGFLIGGYFGAGPDRVAYAGLQFCLGMAIILGMAAFPISSIIVAEERVIGAILGFAIALIIAHGIWPEDPARQLRLRFAHNLRALAEVLRAIDRHDDGRSSALREQVIGLKHDVQAGFGLLYDVSYLLTKRLRPSYDYQGIAHALGALYVQVWSLYETLGTTRDSAQRDVILDVLEGSERRITEAIDNLAGHIEKGEVTDNTAFIVALQSLSQDLTAQNVVAISGLDEDARWRWRFGLNTVQEIIHELTLIARYTDTMQSQTAPNTKTLAKIYEGLPS